MDDIERALKELGAKTGLGIGLDESGSCTLELEDGRPLVLQRRENDLDFVAALGEVPEEVRSSVFERLLAANFYWKGTLGATLSWNDELGQAVLIYPFPLAGASPAELESILGKFLELQAAWKERLDGLVAAASEAGDAGTAPDAPPAEGGDFVINP